MLRRVHRPDLTHFKVTLATRTRYTDGTAHGLFALIYNEERMYTWVSNVYKNRVKRMRISGSEEATEYTEAEE